MTTTYLLVAHGSSDLRSQVELDRLVYLVGQRISRHPSLKTSSYSSTALMARSSLVVSAVLESSEYSLAQQIVRFASQAEARGDRQIVLLPLLLSKGVHLQEDIPAALTRAQNQVGESPKLRLYPYLGSHAGMKDLLARRFDSLAGEHRILVSHGTKREESQQLLAELAHSLSAEIAYWSVAPSFGERIERAIQKGKRQFAIQPYFLFAGGITDAIARQVLNLRSVYPSCLFDLGEPLGAVSPLADLIVEVLLRE